MPEPEPSRHPPVAPNLLAALDEGFSRLAERVQQSSRVADAKSEAEDRSWIARLILWVFAGILIAEGIVTKEWTQVATQAADLVKTSVLPVVTLVLGYYFGRSGKG
jgi:hypothetical protein